MVFVKGQSGNPGGRSKKRNDIAKMFQDALEKIGGDARDVNLAVEILRETALSADTDPKDRIKAVEVMMAYGYGKPVQRNEHTGADGGPMLVAHADRQRISELSEADLDMELEIVEPKQLKGRDDDQEDTS